MKRRRGCFRKERTNEIGREITRLRTALGLTQQEVANRLGWSKSYICKIERNLTTPSPNILAALALACGTRPEYLLAKVHQLQFNLLNAIVAPTELLTDPLIDVTQEERQELIRYLAFLRLKQSTATQS